MYMSNSRREVRREAFERLEAAWETQASLAAMALNFQAGFRLSLYRNRGWDSVLKEPLARGRMQAATLEAMWSAVEAAVPGLLPYVAAKKRLLASIGSAGTTRRHPWARATARSRFRSRRLHQSSAGRFSADMAAFTEQALAQRWVEAENRPAKGAGAFCTGFPTHGETRIFMTWGGEYDHLMTLAHELGHAYHSWVLREAPYWCSVIP